MKQIRATIQAVKYVGSTANGNPTFRITTDVGEYLTVKDGQVGYMTEGAGMSAGPVELEINDQGRVARILPTKEEIDRRFSDTVNDLMNG